MKRNGIVTVLVLAAVSPVLGQAPVELFVTTDANGGAGLSALPTGESTVYVFASGTATVVDFIFDLSNSGSALVFSRAKINGVPDDPSQPIGPFLGGFRDEGLSTNTDGTIDFGWSSFTDPDVSISGTTLLATLDVVVPAGASGSAALLDLAGDSWRVLLNGGAVEINDANFPSAANLLRLAGPASSGGGSGGGGGGGGGTDPGNGEPTGNGEIPPDEPTTPDPAGSGNGSTPGGNGSGTSDPGGTTDPGTDPNTGGGEDPDATPPIMPVGGGLCGIFGAVEMMALCLALGCVGWVGRREQPR